MAIEDWADELTGLWGQISDGQGGNVKSYSMIEKRDFPETIEIVPCALTFIEDMDPFYSEGGPLLDFYRGITEFHISKDIAKSNYPDVYKFIRRIRDKAASNMQLNNKVGGGNFQIDTEGRPGIVGPIVLTYGIGDPHLGLIVNWTVKDNVAGEFQPSA